MADYSLPPEARLIGRSAGPLPITGAGAHTTVPLTPEGRYRLSDPADLSAAGQLYLLLEHVRGTRDATVLNVYLNLPEGALPAAHRARLAGSVGLFGLRMASAPQGDNAGAGLSFMFDVTRLWAAQLAEAAFAAEAVRVSIVPGRPLSEASDIVVESVGLFLLSSS